jgi:hypothetical protein
VSIPTTKELTPVTVVVLLQGGKSGQVVKARGIYGSDGQCLLVVLHRDAVIGETLELAR